MKKILSIAGWLVMAAALTMGTTACSNEDNITDEPNTATEAPKTYTLTVVAGKGGDAALTRALSLDESGAKNVLNATWAAGEQVTVYNVTKAAALEGYLEAQTSGANTTLKGELTGTIEADDELTLKFLSPNYAGQNGTLAYIAENCDYAEATVTVAAVDGSNIATAAAADFQNQQAIVKFMLRDTDGNNLNATSLTIAAASNRLVKGQVHDTPGTYHSGYTATAGSGGFNNEDHSKLLDGNTGTKWCQSGGTYNVTFNTASPVQVDGYTLTTANDTEGNVGRNPKNWTLKGKLNAGDEWTTIAQVTNDNTMPAANFTAVNFVADVPGRYQYFYFEVTATRGADIMQLSELQLWKGTDAVTTAYAPLTVTPASATNELTVALCNASGAADTYTLTATVGSYTYTYEKASVTFTNGQYYEITVKMTKQAARTLAKATAEDLGKIAGADGNIYDDAAAATAAGTSAVAMIAYVGSMTGHATYTHGLAIALADESRKMDWDTAKSACGGKAAVTDAAWLLPSRNQWNAMFSGDGGRYSGLNTAITNAGGTALQDYADYWSSTEHSGDDAYAVYLGNGYAVWGVYYLKDNVYLVRACLAF